MFAHHLQHRQEELTSLGQDLTEARHLQRFDDQSRAEGLLAGCVQTEPSANTLYR